MLFNDQSNLLYLSIIFIFKSFEVTDQKIILVVDDDADDQELINEMISQIDNEFRVDVINNGAQVFQYLSKSSESNYTCLIILDYKMPLLNAAEVLEKMKTDERYLKIPKVVWSTSVEPEHVKRCLTAGAKNYFPKPVMPKDLKAVLKAILDFCDKN